MPTASTRKASSTSGRAGEVEALLDADEFAVAARHWGLDRPPNFERAAWNLRVAVPLADVAQELGIDPSIAAARLAAARTKLLAARARRVRPGRDDKLLTSWNALMIGALAHAARVFDEPTWLESAQRAVDFLRSTLWRDGRLLATYKDGRAHLNAYLDDHAFLLAALLELMQTAFRPQDLAWATELADALLERFEDRSAGGFFFTSHDHEALIHRAKPGTTTPRLPATASPRRRCSSSGIGSARRRYVAAAERTVRLFARGARRAAVGLRVAAGRARRLSASRPRPCCCRATQPLAPRGSERSTRTLSTDSARARRIGTAALPGALAKPHVGGAGSGNGMGMHGRDVPAAGGEPRRDRGCASNAQGLMPRSGAARAIPVAWRPSSQPFLEIA